MSLWNDLTSGVAGPGYGQQADYDPYAGLSPLVRQLMSGIGDASQAALVPQFRQSPMDRLYQATYPDPSDMPPAAYKTDANLSPSSIGSSLQQLSSLVAPYLAGGAPGGSPGGATLSSGLKIPGLLGDARGGPAGPSFATPSGLDERLGRLLGRGPDVGAPKNAATELEPGIFIGNGTHDQWLARTEKVLDQPGEIQEARDWYKNASGAYNQSFGPDLGPQMMGGWLTGNVVMGMRQMNSGSKLGVGIYHPDLADPTNVQAMWDGLVQNHPDFAAGFSPSVHPDGTPGMEMLFDKGGVGVANRIQNELIPGIDKIGDDIGLGGPDLRIGGFKAEDLSREHDWTKDPTATTGYLGRLVGRYGPAIQQRLEDFKDQTLHPLIEREITSRQPKAGGAAIPPQGVGAPPGLLNTP